MREAGVPRQMAPAAITAPGVGLAGWLVASLPCNGCHTNLRLPVVVGPAKGVACHLTGWDWEALCAGLAGREAEEEQHGPDSPIWNTMVMIQNCIMDTKPRCLRQALSRTKSPARLATAGAEAIRTGWTGYLDRQLALNRLDVMHRRLLDSYPPRSRPAQPASPDHMISLARRFQHLSSTQKRPPVTGQF